MQSDDELVVLLSERSRVSAPVLLLIVLGVVPILIGGLLLWQTQSSGAPTVQHFVPIRSLPPFPSTLPSRSASPSALLALTQVSLNQGTESELESLPGIGVTRARQIIQGRPYATVDELRTKTTLPVSIIEKILPYVSL